MNSPILAIVSSIPIPGMTCTWHPEGSGGFWSCELKHDEVALEAYEARERSIQQHGFATLPGPDHFWLEAEQKLIAKYSKQKEGAL